VDDFEENALNKYKVGSDGKLLDSNDQAYKGKHPYIVIS
jgi:hypothetical protein